MVTLIEIDKSGMDFFDRDYAIAVVRDKKEVYGYKIPQKLTDKLKHLFNENSLGINTQNFGKNKKRVRVKVRAHTSCIILLIKYLLRDLGGTEDTVIQICNDYDGHFSSIRDMLYDNLKPEIPNLNLKEHITQQKFRKDSLVNTAAKKIRENKEDLSTYNLPKLDIDEIIKLIKKKR